MYTLLTYKDDLECISLGVILIKETTRVKFLCTVDKGVSCKQAISVAAKDKLVSVFSKS